MKNLKLLILLSGFFLFFSCSKNSEISDLTNFDNKLKDNVALASISPTPSPITSISKLSMSCGVADTLLTNFLYKGIGDVVSGKADTVLSFRLQPYTSASAILKHKFIKGNIYTITIPVNINGYDDSGFLSTSSKSYFPSIEISTLKSAGSNLQSCQLLPESQASDVKVNWQLENGKDISEKQSKNLILTFTAESCFDYITLKASSNVQKYTSIHIKKISISSSSLISFEGESEMCVGQTQKVSFGISGYPLNESVEWYVDGDLQIIGSNIGASVDVKCIGAAGGKIGFKSCAGENGQEFNVRARTLNSTINGVSTVSNENTHFFHIDDVDVETVTWEAWPVQYSSIVSGQGTKNISVSFFGFYNSANPRSAQIKATVKSKCGEVKVITKNVTLKGCRTCPIT